MSAKHAICNNNNKLLDSENIFVRVASCKYRDARKPTSVKARKERGVV